MPGRLRHHGALQKPEVDGAGCDRWPLAISLSTLAKILVCSRLSLSRKSLHNSTALLNLVQASSCCAPCCCEGSKTAAFRAHQQASGPGASWQTLVRQPAAHRCLQRAQACCGGCHIAAGRSPAVSALQHTANKWPNYCCGAHRLQPAGDPLASALAQGSTVMAARERAACRVAGCLELEGALMWPPALL